MLGMLTGILGVSKFYFKACLCHSALSIQNHVEERRGYVRKLVS